MKHIIYSIIVILGITIILSCEEEIDWKEAEMPEMLVVEGSFTNEFKKHQVILSSSAEYFSNTPTDRISGASLFITNGNDIYTMRENPLKSGIYETNDSVAGVPGNTYTLDITLPNPVNNTSHYQSTGKLIKGIDIDSLVVMLYENPVYFENSGIDSLMTVMVVFGQDPSQYENYYQLNTYINDSLLNDTVDEVSYISDVEGINGEFIHTFMFFHQFNINDLIQFEMQSVEKSYFDFLTGVQNIANQSADPFDMSGPPANAIGNIKGDGQIEAIGFFKVAYVSRGFNFAHIPKEEQEE